MSSFASIDDLTAVCGPQADEAAAQAALDAATVAIQSATGQLLSFVENDRVLLDGDGSNTVLLPELPVTAVTSVTVEGVLLDPDDYEWNQTGILRLIGHCCASFPRRLQSIDVTYSHGFDPIPDDLRLATAKLACRSLSTDDHAGVITSERVGQWSASYATGFTHAETLVIDRYRVLV